MRTWWRGLSNYQRRCWIAWAAMVGSMLVTDVVLFTVPVLGWVAVPVTLLLILHYARVMVNP